MPGPRCSFGLSIVLLLLTLPAAAGCSVSGRYEPMTIEVRDAATKEPVPSALVEARALHFFLPVEQGIYYRPHPDEPRSVRGRTDAAGRVRLNVVVHAAVKLVVVAPGYDIQSVMMDEHPAVRQDPSPTEWLDVDPPDDEIEVRRLQIRYER